MEETDSQDFGSIVANPEYSLPDAKKVLVLAPHPDDETLGCGGTIALYTSKGIEVQVAVISDGGNISHVFTGENKNIIDIRKREFLEASKLLGVTQAYFLGFTDGELTSYKDEIKVRVEDIVEKVKPDIIFSPPPVDYHDDHIAVSEIALEILRKTQGMRVVFYEVYETIRFNFLVDISSVVDVKKKAILKYDFSLFHIPELFSEAVKGLSRFRSLFTREDKFYEAFWIISKPIDKSEIINWVTYGLKEKEPAEIFLSKLRSVDELLFELRRKSEMLTASDTEIQELKTVIEKEREYNRELKTGLDGIMGSIAWRAAMAFYRGKERMLPQGSLRRKFYDRLLFRFKRPRQVV